jgi:eukaryotic translation initiation factor 2C
MRYVLRLQSFPAALTVLQTIKSGGTGLGVNVDVANQTFWTGQKFEQLARNYLSCSDSYWANIDYDAMRKLVLPVMVEKGNTKTWGMSKALKALRRLQNIRFEVKHRGNTMGRKEYKVKTIAFHPNFGEMGACAKTVKFKKKMPDGSEKEYSIAEYYLSQYKTKIQHWYLPLIESTNGGFFPMEVCEVVRFNPYPFKLDSPQVCPPS